MFYDYYDPVFTKQKSIRFYLFCHLTVNPHQNPLRKVKYKGGFLQETSEIGLPNVSFTLYCRLFILSSLVSALSVKIEGNNILTSPHIFRKLRTLGFCRNWKAK
jgi:hypothetical protein